MQRFLLQRNLLVAVIFAVVCVVFVQLKWKHAGNEDVQPSVSSFVGQNGTNIHLPCKLTDPLALNAFARAGTDECKFKIAHVSCKQTRGVLTPSRIPHNCPRGKYKPYRSIGCFPHNMNHTIEKNLFKIANMTVQKCVDLCTNYNFRYAGMSESVFCKCSDAEPDPSSQVPDNHCIVPCAGNAKQFCGGFFKTSTYETGLQKLPLSPVKFLIPLGEKPARIGFLMLCHRRNIRQIRRLLGGIYDENHYYYIHVDTRQKYLQRELLKLERDFPNIYIARKRYRVTWGSNSLLKTILSCVKDMLARTHNELDFLLDMSESDFLLKPIGELTRFLTGNKGRNFVQLQEMFSIDEFIENTSFNRIFADCDDRMWLVGSRDVPAGIAINGGGDWFCISRAFAQYVTDAQDDLVQDLSQLAEYSGFSTEFFLHIVLLNSRFCQTQYDASLRVVSWINDLGCSWDRPIDWLGCSPVTIQQQFFSKIKAMETSVDFLARKFDPTIDQIIILALEETLYGSYPTNTPNLHAYWLNIFHRESDGNGPDVAALMNVAYILLWKNSNPRDSSSYELGPILEITSYFNHDIFEGFLVRHLALVNDHKLELEAFIKRVNAYRPADSKIQNIIKSIQVADRYSYADQHPIFHEGIHSIDQMPILILYLHEEANTFNHTAYIQWINPQLNAVAEDHYNISADSNNHHALRGQNLQIPLQPGVWQARISLNESEVGLVEFLVSSSEPHFPKRITTRDQCRRTAFQELIQNQCKALGEAFYPLSQLSKIIERFYGIEHMCIVTEENDILPQSYKSLENCLDTAWSSLSPDPKSDVHFQLKRNKNRML